MGHKKLWQTIKLSDIDLKVTVIARFGNCIKLVTEYLNEYLSYIVFQREFCDIKMKTVWGDI